MDDSKDFLERYFKVKNTIESCATKDHTKVADQMIDNLTVLCFHNSLSYEFYIFYIDKLKSLLNKKIDEIS
jgi:hypothetical protein